MLFYRLPYSGSYNDNDVLLLKNFTRQFNDYSVTTKISNNFNFDSPADIWLDFLPSDSLNQIKIDSSTTVYKNLQTGTIYFIQTSYYISVKLRFEDLYKC